MKSEIIDKFAILITSAFGLVAALAWNEAMKGAFAKWEIQFYGPWIYAGFVTILAVVLTLWVGRLAEKTKQIDIEKEVRKRLRKK
ncbi:MAG: hypothetical protein KKA65_05535 [Nanoarchaeota archaeon]|nr:hypothetical protein [Nanoarchaeota archaeon]MBU4242024.1 hypothetical protein [Nanoarchaeota archaeon]MBU4352690.1 hypothetical protein [Nanoarchaeota archaeon]MBU4456932.1 hypothetical protein [Nanoarchaeota archaeon]MCG2719213.1 DUF5654 family protein [Nanoarchaeota archaeon]